MYVPELLLTLTISLDAEAFVQRKLSVLFLAGLFVVCAAAQSNLAVLGGRVTDPQSHVNVGDAAPDFTLTKVDKSGAVHLAELNQTQPVVLVFGSYT